MHPRSIRLCHINHGIISTITVNVLTKKILFLYLKMILFKSTPKHSKRSNCVVFCLSERVTKIIIIIIIINKYFMHDSTNSNALCQCALLLVCTYALRIPEFNNSRWDNNTNHLASFKLTHCARVIIQRNRNNYNKCMMFVYRQTYTTLVKYLQEAQSRFMSNSFSNTKIK